MHEFYLLYLSKHWPMKFDSFHLGDDRLVDNEMMNSEEAKFSLGMTDNLDCAVEKLVNSRGP